MKIITQNLGNRWKRKGEEKMKKLTILAILAMILAANVGNAHAWDTRKFGPTTIYNPDITQMPLDGTETVLPSII